VTEKNKRVTREDRRRRHLKRMKWIVSFGLILMLIITCEYVRGGSSGLQNSIDQLCKRAEVYIKQIERKLEYVYDRLNGGEVIVPAEGELQVHFLAVGQADSVLIFTDDAAMLVDGGRDEDGEAVAAYIRHCGIEHLDYVIGTHPHEDHIGGLDHVLRQIDTEMLILPEKDSDEKPFIEMMDVVQDEGITVLTAQAGSKYNLGEGSFTILGPVRDYEDSLNDWSAAIRLVFGETSFVMTGDAEQSAEEDIVESGVYLRSDVWKAGHHGSETSNTDWILDVVDPDYTVISCGKDNSYGHPNASVLREFERRGIEVFRTDEQGTIVAECDGEKIMWNVEDKSPNGS